VCHWGGIGAHAVLGGQGDVRIKLEMVRRMGIRARDRVPVRSRHRCSSSINRFVKNGKMTEREGNPAMCERNGVAQP
jgi:hypothetical protein